MEIYIINYLVVKEINLIKQNDDLKKIRYGIINGKKYIYI
jgi:hypothetical protein